MALTTKRIIALPSQSDPQEGDYLAIDNATSGTKKIPVGRIGVEVDDTLTEAGKAADAKAVGDALDEIRSQIEVTGTASGAIATFTDGAEMPAKSVIVNIEPKQAGSGTPSPSNVRAISGWESVNVNVAGENLIDVSTNQSGAIDASGNEVANSTFNRTDFIPIDKAMVYVKTSAASGYTMRVHGYSSSKAWVQQLKVITTNGTTLLVGETVPNNVAYVRISYPVIAVDNTELWQADAATTVNLGRTVYGGTLDVVSGALTAYPYYPSYNGETLNGRWVCDRAVYAEGTTPPTGSQVALISGTGTTYQLTPTEIQTLLGENNVWADSGDVEVVYVRDLNITINNLLNNNGTRSLGMMAMSAPTEATAEEPTDEPAEDDMR